MVPKLPPLPPAVSWYPGHMASFAKSLPQLLQNTHVVLEARDARLPLTSINPNFEGLLKRWYQERGNGIVGPVERIVVYNKADLVPSWGIEPFKKALGKHYNHDTYFTTAKLGKSMGTLHDRLAAVARKHSGTIPHLNVLVVGMPNVGKSTILNHLRSYGIRGASSAALRTSRLPGMTRMASNRLRLCDDPLIYSVDSPGVMVPFLGYGDESRERAVKICMILGMNESLVDYDYLAAYLLFRINTIEPTAPPYPPVLTRASKSKPPMGAIESVEDFLDELANRMGYLLPGGVPDRQRAATWFVEWWRANSSGGDGRDPRMSTLGGTKAWGWGLDCEWVKSDTESEDSFQQEVDGTLEDRFDRVIARHLETTRNLEEDPSQTQMRKREKEEKIQQRIEKGEDAAKKRQMAARRSKRR